MGLLASRPTVQRPLLLLLPKARPLTLRLRAVTHTPPPRTPACHPQEETGVPCECNEYVGELLRGVRQHLGT